MAYYDVDLAYVHDASYGDVAREAATMIVNTLKDNGIDAGLVVDLGCGSGILAEKLLAAGYDVLGIDQSKDFIAIAQKRAHKGTFIQGSFFDAHIPSCVAVISTGECLNYLFDESNNAEALQKLFKRIFSALEPNGLFIFDILSPSSNTPREYKNIIDDSSWTIYLHVHEDIQKQTLTRDITLFRKVGEHYRKSKEVHNVRLYRQDQIMSYLRNCGFNVSTFNQYGNLMLQNDHVGFLCKKVQ